MPCLRSVKQIKNLKNKRVLLRADFNVPLKNGRVADDYKIRKGLPTIKYLLSKGARVIIVSHLGRPQGADKKLSLRPVKNCLEKILKKKIKIVDLRRASAATGKDTLIMLENIRFYPGEEKNGDRLAEDLAALADFFVLDGFAAAHRGAASVSGVAKYLPSFAGFLLADEADRLSRVLESPRRPLTVVLGGVKMETKIPALKNLLAVADHVLLGGSIANTCLWSVGYNVGASFIEKEYKKEALSFSKNAKIILPIDVVAGKKNGKEAKVFQLAAAKNLNADVGIFDIGPATIQLYAQFIKKAQTLVWNGAMGYFERHPYEYGTRAIARLIASRAKGQAFGVCGGGETAEVLRKLKLADDIDLVSTGGGAMLEFLSGKKLPGVEAVKE